MSYILNNASGRFLPSAISVRTAIAAFILVTAFTQESLSSQTGPSSGSGNYPPEEYLKINIIYTNDVHGGIDPQEATFINPEFPPMLGGGGIAARYIGEVRDRAEAKGEGFLLLDAGDFFQGTPLGTLTHGTALVKYMNRVGYDVTVVGNHEFDQGWRNLARLAGLAEFPFLGANVRDRATGNVAGFLKPYILKDVAGIKVALVGITTSTTPGMAFPDHIEGLEFLRELEVARKYVDEVRSEGADLVIVMTHAWLPYDPVQGYSAMLTRLGSGDDLARSSINAMEMARLVTGIDVIFSGHLHKGFNEPWVDPKTHTLVFQNYGNGTNLGHVNLYIHRETLSLAGWDFPADAGALLTLFEDDFNYDRTVADTIDKWVALAEAGWDEVIGAATAIISRANQGESALGNIVLDAMLEYTGADIAFSNYGGLRTDLRPGAITPRDVFKVLPFGNKLVIHTVHGEFIQNLVEERVKGDSRGMLLAGAQVTIDRSRPDGERVVALEIGDQPVNRQREYRLVVTDYLSEGNSGYGLLTTVPEDKQNYTGILDRDTLIEYIRQHSPLRPRLDGRWVEVTLYP